LAPPRRCSASRRAGEHLDYEVRHAFYGMLTVEVFASAAQKEDIGMRHILGSLAPLGIVKRDSARIGEDETKAGILRLTKKQNHLV